MVYLVPVVLIVLGIGSKFIVELSGELSNKILLDNDPGIELGGTRITAGGIVDMRPETAIAGAAWDVEGLTRSQ